MSNLYSFYPCSPCDFKNLTLESPNGTISITKDPRCKFLIDIDPEISDVFTDPSDTITFTGVGLPLNPLIANLVVNGVNNSLTDLLAWDGSAVWIREASSIETVLTFTDGLTRTSDTIRNDFFTGKGASQTLYGATTSGGDLTISSTAHATKGTVFFGSGQDSIYDEVNNRWGLDSTTPTQTLSIGQGGVETLTLWANNPTSAEIHSISGLTISGPNGLGLRAGTSGTQIIVAEVGGSYSEFEFQTGGGSLLHFIGQGTLVADDIGIEDSAAELYIKGVDSEGVDPIQAEVCLYHKLRFRDLPLDNTANNLVVIDEFERVRYRDANMATPQYTATAASALTATNGMLIYVTDTNGTFTSIGFWGRENGAWNKL